MLDGAARQPRHGRYSRSGVAQREVTPILKCERGGRQQPEQASGKCRGAAARRCRDAPPMPQRIAAMRGV
jgi:hypothetical protein